MQNGKEDGKGTENNQPVKEWQIPRRNYQGL
jgi:hypothetical protein